ncbi:hypothetical protein [Rhizorhabdus sp. FW153]|uniref:hypothetical protein n=1 Tax=Rhizorhabdus sp. FW153 TaxID=3400216 RepID=UPI003CECCF25
MRVGILVLPPLLLAACGYDPGAASYDALVDQVSAKRVGADTDQWIEVKNIAGEWERTGLIFGYADDYEECAKAIGGLKKVNYAREYRCVPAN